MKSIVHNIYNVFLDLFLKRTDKNTVFVSCTLSLE